MNSKSSSIQARAWASVGAMAPEAIFARLDERVARSFDDAEAVALSRNFEAICDAHGHVFEPQFTNFVVSKGRISPDLTRAIHILFNSLCYLSQVPLQTASPPPVHLTLNGLKRALVWILPGKEQSVCIADVNERVRSPTDHLRLIFQSMATSHEKIEVPLPLRAVQSLTVFDTATVPTEHIYSFRDHSQHFDQDGDEMFHDVMDVLWSTQPHIPIGHAEPIRDAFRPLAKKLHEGAPSLYELVIPSLRLKSFLSLLVATSFDEAPLAMTQDLELVTQCIAASFHQRQALDQHNGQTIGVSNGSATWPMFHFAVNKLLPNLLDSLSSLVSEVFLDGTCLYNPHASPRAVFGSVLTLPRMVQLESFLYNSLCMADTQVLHVYSRLAMPTPATLIQSIETANCWTLLIVSGRTETGEAYIFGVHFTDPKTYGDRIQDLDSATESTAILFQLSPIHDVFRGMHGTLAWSTTDDKVMFGREGHGVALSLDGSRLEKACFTHRPSGIDESTVYRPTSHRGAFKTRFTIETIELWAQE